MVRNQVSSLLQVSGVPQGPCWVPFCSRCLSMTPSVVSSPTFMFADDSYKDFSFCKKYSDDHATLQNDLNVLHEWGQFIGS